ncbi:hypothetical protein ACIGHF_16155 [Stenotrophomonas sp. NPDC077464]|uniref:hypothetical protein n=1 Tax=unclassified Stenotrophomonas TaxID=196198 RepID=UPI0037CD33B6
MRQNAAGTLTEYAMAAVFCAVHHVKPPEKAKISRPLLLQPHNLPIRAAPFVPDLSWITQN